MSTRPNANCRQQVFQDELSTIPAARQLPQKIIQRAKSLMALAT